VSGGLASESRSGRQVELGKGDAGERASPGSVLSACAKDVQCGESLGESVGEDAFIALPDASERGEAGDRVALGLTALGAWNALAPAL
jgi:hypothetical protein